jgi:hypothetical protein
VVFKLPVDLWIFVQKLGSSELLQKGCHFVCKMETLLQMSLEVIQCPLPIAQVNLGNDERVLATL